MIEGEGLHFLQGQFHIFFVVKSNALLSSVNPSAHHSRSSLLPFSRGPRCKNPLGTRSLPANMHPNPSERRGHDMPAPRKASEAAA